MTTFHTDCETDGAPAPSDVELAAMDAQAKHPKFTPFVAVKCNRLVTIIGKTKNGHYMDNRGHLHRLDDLERDLVTYAERARADARDQADTYAEALR